MTLQSDLCATLVDEFRRAGMTEVVLAPGSRSSLLALAFLAEDRLRTHVRLDERTAAFYAIGLALGTARPVALVTTSGTAAVEVHSAVAEADLSRIPLVVCTADRPVELHDVGAPQTIVQRGVYGAAVRYELELVAEEATRPHWRSMAARLIAEATDAVAGPGPVHLNLALREPFSPEPGVVLAGRPGDAPWHRVLRARLPSVEVLEAATAALRRARRGVIVAGGGGEVPDDEAVLSLARALGWPILAEPRALRRVKSEVLVAHADLLLRSASVEGALAPDVIVELGAPHTSRVVGRFLERAAAAGAPRLLVDPFGRFADPARQADLVLGTATAGFCRALMGSGRLAAAPPAWLAAWRAADDGAAAALAAAETSALELSEPLVARAVFRALPGNGAVFSSASMPIRDLEWFAAAADDAPAVFANRGANGIDGVTSTGLGLARALGADAPVVIFLGDLAFFHDIGALVRGALEEEPSATVVVVDNGGGGIFSFLDYAPGLERAVFERAFGTPQATSIPSLAEALGCRVARVATRAALDHALERAISRRGLDLVHVEVPNRSANVAAHAALATAAATGAEAALASGRSV